MTESHVTVVDRDRMADENDTRVQALLDRLAGHAADRGTRALLVVDMPPGGEPSEAVRAPTGRSVVDGADRADRLAARLGTENLRLLHDARGVPDPALLAAEIGTLARGGVLVLLTGEPLTRSAERFARHLGYLIEKMPDTSARIALPASELSMLESLCEACCVTPRLPDLTARHVEAIAVQDDSLDTLTARLDSARRTATLIVAGRGHGKSALLGRFAARLERRGIRYRVVAARRAGTDVLDRHRRLAFAGESETPAPLPFLAPDAALAGDGETVLVDEAASLPLPLIETLLERYPHVVLASTSEGHESGGRAFALKIPALLDRTRPDAWSRLTPSIPLRWRDGDPLDAFVSGTLLPRAGTASRESVRDALGIDPPLVDRTLDAVEVERDALVADERRLSAVSALLAATHYQSSPLDLVHLLDSPALRLWAVEHGDVVLGVALVAIEPGLPHAVHDDVLARRRRLPHRLLPQLLAQCADDPGALAADFARVVRIAVHPDARRRGIGRRLTETVVRDTATEVEAVGASFGASESALSFWQDAGFRRFHVGFRRNPRSGERSAAVMRAGSPRVAGVLAAAESILHDNALEAELPEAAVRGARPSVEPDRDTRLLRRFAATERSTHDTLGALYRLARGQEPPRTTADARSEAIPGHDGHADDAACLLDMFGEHVPPSPRQRERALRDAVRARLDAGAARGR